MPHYTEALENKNENNEQKQNKKINNSMGKHNNKSTLNLSESD